LFYYAMATFTTETYNAGPIGGVEHGHPDQTLWRYYVGIPTGYSVLITSGAASTFPGILNPTTDQINGADSGSGDNGKAAFIGGRTYTITAGEKTILDAAGYTTVA
jgi:hypothetical protein